MTWVIHDDVLKVLAGSDPACSNRWVIETFQSHTQQSDLQQHASEATVSGEKLSCPKCLHRSDKKGPSGNFACFLETSPDEKNEYHDKCVLAPTERDCYALGLETNPGQYK